MNVMKTVRTRITRTRPAVGKTAPVNAVKLSTTTPIPMVAIVEDLDVRSSSHLDIFLPGHSPRRIELGRGEITVGRDENCSIHLPLANVSREHARLFVKGEEFMIEDLESTNGTMVNGVKIRRCILRNNDNIRIGEARIQFVQQKFRG